MRFAGPLVAGVIVLAAIVTFVMTQRASDQIKSMEAAQTETATEVSTLRGDIEAVRAEAANERRHAQQATAEATRLAEENVALQAQIDALREELAEATAEPAPEAPAATSAFPAYTPDGLGEALATVDWEIVADSMSHMPPLIAQLAEHLAEGRSMMELSAETVGSIQRYNGPLVTVAMRLSQQGVAGTDVNGAFSHPGFMSNALAATLLELEMPLDAEQSAKLDALTADFSARETKRVAGYDDDTYAIERLVDESHLKHDFFQQMYALLTPAQHTAVRPEAVRGRTQLDIFCEGLAWAGKAGPLVYQNLETLKTQAATWVISRTGATAVQQDPIRGFVDSWVDELPETFLNWEADGLAQSGMMHTEHVVESAEHVLSLLRKLDRELDLDEAGRARLRAVPGSIVPYKAASGD